MDSNQNLQNQSNPGSQLAIQSNNKLNSQNELDKENENQIIEDNNSPQEQYNNENNENNEDNYDSPYVQEGQEGYNQFEDEQHDYMSDEGGSKTYSNIGNIEDVREEVKNLIEAELSSYKQSIELQLQSIRDSISNAKSVDKNKPVQNAGKQQDEKKTSNMESLPVQTPAPNQDSIKGILSKLKMLKTTNSKEISGLERKISKINAERLDGDSYFYTSSLIYYLVVFLFALILSFLILLIFPVVRFIYLITCGKFGSRITFDEYKNIIFVFAKTIGMMVYLFFLMLPGIIVIGTQTMCINELLKETSSESTEDVSHNLMILKVIIGVFFFFMISNEINSAINIGFYIIIEGFNKKNSNFVEKGISLIQIIPQAVQIFYAFWISYINLELIRYISNPSELIQNYAGLIILLDFDNFIMSFLRNIDMFFYLNRFLMVIDSDYKEKCRKKQEIKDKMEQKKKVRDKKLKQSNTIKKDGAVKPEDQKKKEKKVSDDIGPKKKNEGMTFNDLMNSLGRENGSKFITALGEDIKIKSILRDQEFIMDPRLKKKIDESKMNLNIIKLVIMIAGMAIVFPLAYDY